MKKKKILIALPYGQTIRDVLRSETYYELKNSKDLDIVIVCSESRNTEFQNEFGGHNVKFEYLHKYRPNILEIFWQSFYLSTIAFKSNTIRIYAKNDKKSALRFLTPLSNTISRIIGRFRLQKIIGFFMRLSNFSRDYKEIFNHHNPDLVIVTRVLRGSPDYPILKEAALRKISVVALVSSWDNFTTKGFFPFGVKKLVVWNQIMKEEAEELFGFPTKDIFISGIPRFDNYFNLNDKRSKEVFFKAHDLDIRKKLITYTTGNKSLVLPPGDKTSAEVDIAIEIASAITKGSIKDAQLLVRLHPLADESDYAPLINMKHVKIQIPGKKNSFIDRLFSKDDDRLLAETLIYSDVILNVASTITIDAAIFDTPSISISYDPRGELPTEFSVKRIYEYEHYRKLIKTGGVNIAASPVEMIDKIKEYILKPSLNSDKRAAIVKQQCDYIDGRSGYRVANFILEHLKSV